jgi:hypothetical protein
MTSELIVASFPRTTFKAWEPREGLMSHLVGRAQVWKARNGKAFFKCAQPQCTTEHEVSAKNLVADKNSASGQSIKLSATDGAWITIPLGREILALAPWLLKDISSAA